MALIMCCVFVWALYTHYSPFTMITNVTNTHITKLVDVYNDPIRHLLLPSSSRRRDVGTESREKPPEPHSWEAAEARVVGPGRPGARV